VIILGGVPGRMPGEAALLPILMIISLLFSLIEFGNYTRLQFYFFHSVRYFYAEVAGARADIYIWFVSTFLLALIFLARRGRSALSIAPVGLCMVALIAYDVGLHLHGVVLMGLASLLVNGLMALGADRLGLDRASLLRNAIIVAGFILIPLQAYAIAVWATHPFTPGYPFDANPRWLVPKLLFNLFNVGYALAAPGLLLILTGWVWAPLASRLAGWPFAAGHSETPKGFGAWPIALGGALISGSFLAYYPSLHIAHPVGADAPYYLNLLRYMEGLGSPGLVIKNVVLTGEPHIPYLMLLYATKEALGLSPLGAVQLGPIFLAILLVLSTFYAVREITADSNIGALASLLSSASGIVVVGMFYAIYANWMAMALIMFIVGLVVRYLGTGSKGAVGAGAILGLLVGYTHPWTWAYFMIVILALGLLLTMRRSERWRGVIAFLVINIGVAAASLALNPSAVLRPDPGSSWQEVARQFGAHNIPSLLQNASETLANWAASYYSNWILLLFMVVGLASLRSYGQFRALATAWLGVGFFGFALFTPIYEWRILYDLPLTVLLTLGLYRALGWVGRLDRRASARGWLSARLILLVLVLLSAFESALRTLAFLAF